MHIFPDIVHQCHANYDPNLRAVMPPDQQILFSITTDSINEILQLQTSQNLTPLSISDLLDKSSKLSSSEIARVCKMFMLE